jgi:hypothetical protein
MGSETPQFVFARRDLLDLSRERQDSAFDFQVFLENVSRLLQLRRQFIFSLDRKTAAADSEAVIRPVRTTSPSCRISDSAFGATSHASAVTRWCKDSFPYDPTINNNAGRDHWPRVSCALLAGGGMRTGQMIGSTDHLGGEARERPLTFQEVFATLYHSLGVDLNAATFNDLNGRPRYLVAAGVQPIRDLIG